MISDWIQTEVQHDILSVRKRCMADKVCAGEVFEKSDARGLDGETLNMMQMKKGYMGINTVLGATVNYVI